MAQVLSSQTRLAPRRSTFEIRMDILRVVAEGAVKPTHIMYRSNTSWIMMQKNLESLLAAGFMLQAGGDARTEYSITEKGREVLADYLKLVSQTAGGPGPGAGEVPW
jgi:predicted transcriptional regulator